MTRGGSEPLVLENRHTGERLELRRFGSGDDAWLEIRGSLPPGREGPPLHLHTVENEEGRVLSGTLSLLIDGRELRLGAGDKLEIPRGSVHRWWNAGEEPLRFLGAARPVVDLDRYLQAAFEVLNASPPGRPSLFYMAHVAYRHRATQRVVMGPRILQTVLLPLVVLVGTVLGRYRGVEWPGCPARCTGAPPSAHPSSSSPVASSPSPPAGP